jgi:two-component system, OmpR family, sensor histidine kinase PhoQ
MSGSISRRLLLSSAVLVCVFLGLAGLSLDAAYRQSSRDALLGRLQAHIYTLLAAAQEDAKGRLRLPQAVPTPELNRPDSGLYAQVVGENGRYRWRSASMLGRKALPQDDLPVGEQRQRSVDGLLLLEQSIGWADYDGKQNRYVLSVASDGKALRSEQADFRHTLWGWLGGVGVLLLLSQLALVRWGLRPLNLIAERVHAVETGNSERIEGPVPRELLPLTENLNSLIDQGHARQQRLRHSLADLSHSLKTPLSVLRGAAHQANPELAQLIDEHTQRIDQIVSYHRQRAAVAGNTALSPLLPLRPVVQRIVDSLMKVHRDRHLRCQVDIDPALALRVDEGDLFELCGNLLENAFKHAAGQIAISAGKHWLKVDDDGDGIPADQVQRLLRRGQRADQRHPGEGIGLAVVDEIVRQYGGRLAIDRSALGGASIGVHLPD